MLQKTPNSPCDDFHNENLTNNNNIEYSNDYIQCRISDTISDEFQNHSTLLEKCNLQTYLNHYRNNSDVKLFNDEEYATTNLDAYESNLQDMITNVSMCSLSTTPPDLVYFEQDLMHDNVLNLPNKQQPDLIKSLKRGEIFENVAKHDVKDEFDTNDEKNPLPINIVGDFEKEVEQEINVIVSGYKNNNQKESYADISPPMISHFGTFNKIIDANLSNGKEALTSNFSPRVLRIPTNKVNQNGHFMYAQRAQKQLFVTPPPVLNDTRKINESCVNQHFKNLSNEKQTYRNNEVIANNFVRTSHFYSAFNHGNTIINKEGR